MTTTQEPKKLPIAIQLYSVRDDLEGDFEGTVRKIKEFGYDGVELCGFYGKTPLEMKEFLDSLGLKAVCAHVGIAEMRQDMEKVVADYKAVGCEYVALPWLPEEDRLETEKGGETIADISRFCKIANDNGLPLCYHNHEFEFVKMDNGEYALDWLYSRIPDLKVEQDVCWVSASGENPVEYLEKYSNRTPLLHLKDYAGSRIDNNLELRPVGYGVQDIKGIVASAEKNNVQWLIVEQDFPSMDKTALECAKLSIDYLKNI